MAMTNDPSAMRARRGDWIKCVACGTEVYRPPRDVLKRRIGCGELSCEREIRDMVQRGQIDRTQVRGNAHPIMSKAVFDSRCDFGPLLAAIGPPKIPDAQNARASFINRSPD